MVIKLQYKNNKQIGQFESSVISYGNQTGRCVIIHQMLFESGVISYGNKT